MKAPFKSRGIRQRSGERGQTMILVVLALGIFLLGFIALAVDYTNLWFHRQTAQTAADAACQAGAVNMLLAAQGAPTTTAGFTVGTAFNCSNTPNAVPCRYAALNGYTATGLVAGTESKEVSVTFPGTVSGVTPPPSTLASTAFMRVDAINRVPVTFAAVLSGSRTQDVRAAAICGLQQAKVPIPMIVLNPTCQHPFEVSGSATIKIVGGPNKSIQVNSSNLTCAAATNASSTQCFGSGTIDLSQGGPNFTGSQFGVFGAPSTAPTNFLPGTTGSWVSPASPISDPYRDMPVPALPTDLGTSQLVAYGVSGCPDHSGCRRYQPGLYTSPIVVSGETAIFVPGIYYVSPLLFTGGASGGGLCGSPGSGCTTGPVGNCRGALVIGANGVVRPSTDVGDGSGGVMFYLSGATSKGSIALSSNAGNSGGRTIDSFSTAAMTCPGGTPPDSSLGLPSQVDGNVLLGQCTGGGTYVAHSGSGAARGVVIFKDRTNGDPNGQTNLQGGGGMAIGGTVYATHCTSSPCSSSDYRSFVTLQGTPGSSTFVVGQIISDQIVLSGTPTVAMQLSTDSVLSILKVQLLR